MINYDEFLDKYYPSANTSRKNDVKRFLENYEKVTKDMQPQIVLLDKRVVCQLFFLQQTGSISRSHYQKVKEYIINLFDFVGVNGVIPTREEVISSQDKVCFFRSIEALLDFIDKVGSVCMDTYNPTADLVRVKSICVLGWLGFTPSEIANLKKKDLKLSSCNSKFIINHSSDTYEISGAPFASLFYLRTLQQYRSIPHGKLMVLKGNEDYLFRPTVSHCDRLDEGQIIQTIKRFNSQIPDLESTSIVFRNLHKNALFLEIYYDKRNNSLIEKIISIMKCTPNSALNYKEQYLKFASAMDNNEI